MQQETVNEGFLSPNHFFEEPALSTTSTTPGRSASIDGTWFARIPMSPVAADKLTCTTSVEVKIAYERVGVTDSSSGSEKVLFCH